jgi:hypothetical protein
MKARAFFGEVGPVHRQKCGTIKMRADSTKVETALRIEAVVYMAQADKRRI